MSFRSPKYKESYLKYLKTGSDSSCIEFIFDAIDEYIRLVTGSKDTKICFGCVTGITDDRYKAFVQWIKQDRSFREWFAKEFNLLWKWDDKDELDFEDLRWIGVKKSDKPLGSLPPPEAKPRDVDDLKPEV